MSDATEPTKAVPPLDPPEISRRRWAWFTGILASYPLILGALGASGSSQSNEEALPAALGSTASDLINVAFVELTVFAIFFGAAMSVARPSASALFLKWEDWRSVPRGFAYSIGLRIAIGILTMIILVATSWYSGESLEDLGQSAQPDISAMVDGDALQNDPVYLTMNVTLVSFVLGGLREELWRAGLLAGAMALFPGAMRTALGRWSAVTLIAVVFGLGHLTQGLAGVALTGALGIGLGWIILKQRSIWDAVFAHGFFNATSFLLMYILLKKYPDLSPF